MLGAIIGDIAGSIYEFDKSLYNKDKVPQPLYNSSCFLTDDSVMTLAIADACMTWRNLGFSINSKADTNAIKALSYCAEKSMHIFGNMYPNMGYGGMFKQWLKQETPKPYGSKGNGALMRVSPVGWVAETEFEAIEMAKAVTSVTHNTDEAINGATAVALAILHGRFNTIESRIISLTYDFVDVVDEIYPKVNERLEYSKFELFNYYRDNGYEGWLCNDTLPQAALCLLLGMRTYNPLNWAISIGGDSDTLGAIVGSISQAFGNLYMTNKEMICFAFKLSEYPKLCEIDTKFCSRFNVRKIGIKKNPAVWK